MEIDVLLLGGSLLSFAALVCTWLALPATAPSAEPSRVVVPRRSAAEA